MKELSIYFEPLGEEYKTGQKEGKKLKFITDFHTENAFPDYEDADIAIFGVNEGRSGVVRSYAHTAPDHIRTFLYELYPGDVLPKVVDLGNIKAGNTIEDTYFAVQNVVEGLLERNLIPVILGGTQDITYANYKGYESREQTVNLLTLDPEFDLGDVEGELNSESYLGKIVLHQPNFLFNFSNIGYQRYFVDKSIIELMEGLYFDLHRLGEIRSDVKHAEPVIRNADIISIDMASVRNSDAPGAVKSSPHGFYGEEICQMTRYAGMSDKLSSIGIYNYDPKEDKNGQTAHLIAQMIWHFFEGFYARKKDFPLGKKDDYIKYRVNIKNLEHELVFFKSPKSDRWWIEVPYPPDKRLKFERHCMIPCRYEDYELSLKEELPDIWWKTYKKLS